MSGYEDYNRVSDVYDVTRQPLGVEIILGCLVSHGAPPEATVLVDAGCGTGNYARALVSRVARIEAVDLNPGMLEKARSKLAGAVEGGRVSFHQASIDALPLADASADAVMLNQVLHHLNDNAAAGWPGVRAVLAEFARVLRPGGVVIINICSHEQLTHAWWYLPLIPEALSRLRDRHIPLRLLKKRMQEAGIGCIGSFVPVDGLMQGESYFNGHGPLDENWRAGDSIWALVSEAELERALGQVRALDRSGKLEDYVKANDVRRKDIGQFTFLCGLKEPI